MTSQTKTDERIALENVAKALDIKGRLPLQDAALIAKIELAKSKLAEEAEVKEEPVAEEVVAQVEEEVVQETVQSTPARKKAPRMNVAGINNDARTETIARLEREDPDSKYIFQNSGISDKDLAAKGLERTGQMVKNDCVCRTTKESFVEHQQLKNEAQYEAMQRIDGGTGIVGNFESKAKASKDKS